VTGIARSLQGRQGHAAQSRPERSRWRQRGPEIRLADQREELVAEIAEVVRAKQKTVDAVRDDRVDGRQTRGEHRCAARHRFEDDVRVRGGPVGVAPGKHHEVERVERLRGVHVTEQLDARMRASPDELRFFEVSGGREHETGFRLELGDLVEGVEGSGPLRGVMCPT
jgi:hypothetical protein